MSTFTLPSDHRWMYDVFLNFNIGKEDTLRNFISHLYSSFKNAELNTFIDVDDVDLEKGKKKKKIDDIYRAIEGSQISIIVFSKNYADSSWCLNELVKILKCHRSSGQLVLPVFYSVDPAHVRHQIGDFGDSYTQFLRKQRWVNDAHVLAEWKKALTEAANLSGVDVRKYRNESYLIEKIVDDISRIVCKTYLPISHFSVGVEPRVQDVVQLLEKESERACIVGIWGMGGIGKTTIAKAIFNKLQRNFADQSFLENIRGVWAEKDRSRTGLQERLLSDILKRRNIKIHSIEWGKIMIQKNLLGRRTLIVLDDVTNFEQLNALCTGKHELNAPGSVMIITTRDVCLLQVLKVDYVYEMKEMNVNESLELFSWHAFKKGSPREDFIELSRNVVAYCGGLPLALEVLGSYLYERTKQQWKSVLSKLERIPHKDVQKKLKLSFDGLDDLMEKDIFLDICCFFIGKDRAFVTKILDGCGLNAEIGITVLMERSLIKVEKDNKLGMHDLLRDMGREIVRESSPDEPEKRSRLWFHEDVLDVLTEHTGTKVVQGLALKLQRSSKACLSTNAFEKMKTLRLLQLVGVHLAGDYKYLPKQLRWVDWKGFALRCIPDSFNLKNVVAIELKHSNLQLVWKEPQMLEKLKILNLSHSKYLTKTPDFSYLPNLEELILKDCPNLSEVHQSIGDLCNLLLINIKDCPSLKNLPRTIYKLKSLKTLIISGCSKIAKLEDIEQMGSLTTLNADFTGVKHVPFSIVRSKSIGYISLCGHEGLANRVFPSLIRSWMSPTTNPLSYTQPFWNISTSLVSVNVQNNSLGDISPMLGGFSKIRGVWVQCCSESQLTQELRILDDLCDVSCSKLEWTLNASQVLENCLGYYLIGMGSYHQVINTLNKSIQQGLASNSSSDFSLPATNYPYWLSYTGEGHSVLFQVPEDGNFIMKGMTLCVVYSSTSQIVPSECITSVLIVNHTNFTIQIYKRDKAISFNDEDWCGVMSNLRPGDYVEIFVIFGHGLTVKKITVYLIYGPSVTVKKASSSSKSDKKWMYDVFLNFRGKDTQRNFISHLYSSLSNAGVNTFIYDRKLEKGQMIKDIIFRAIEGSHISIVVFSKTYAESRWCLDELVKIMESHQDIGQLVIPVYYDVDPSDVRYLKGTFGEAFQRHPSTAEVRGWEWALTQAENLSGLDLRNYRHESELIEEIVKQVWTKLEPKMPINTNGLISIENKVNDLYSHLRLGLQDVHLIGIWGMGGIGKTTLADVVFNRIKSLFDFSCFVANVREASNEGDQGLVKLQDKLLSHLKPKSMIIDTLSQGKDLIKNLLHNKKVLVVLDDVNAEIQLECLAGNQNWFGPGSRIIVTTRDRHLLISHGLLLDIYEMRIMNDQESLLFCEKAFKGNQPLNDYLELSKKVVEYAGGLPLALKVFSSLLRGRSVQEWEAYFTKIRQVPPGDILHKLKISYDMLEDEGKTIFLIIACFFKGWTKKRVTTILDNCGLHPTIGITILIEKSLVTCDDNLLLGMHGLIEEMGKNIVFQESPLDPGRRRWLWSPEDINKVLTKTAGTEKVQGIFFRKTMSYDAHCQPNVFSNMCNLRLLIIYGDLHLPLGLNCFSSSLNVLIWKGFPLKALPLGVQLDELVYLQMRHSKIEKLWNGTHFFGKLKEIDLAYSEDLIEIPDISGVPNLTKLFLDGCTKLVKVHYSVVQHKNLELLTLSGCINLETLPSKLEMCSLKWLFLSGCSKLRRLPDFEEKMECVSEIQLGNCENLLSLPNTISNLKSLKILNIYGCYKVDRLPDNINENNSLEDLDLSYTSIREVNSSLFQLENLKRLRFEGCSGPGTIFKSTESLILPRFISNLSSVITLNLSDCNLKSLPEDIGQLPSLERLDLMWNANLTLHFASMANLPKLRCLVFDGDMCGSRTLLHPSVRIYPEDCAAETSVVNGSMLWKLFESCCTEDERIEDCLPYSLFGIPSRIINENNSTYCFVGPVLSRHDSCAYIPSNYGMGAWWGIAVFVVLDPLKSSPMPLMKNSMYLEWFFEPLSEDVKRTCLITSTTANSNHYVITMIMNDNLTYIQRHQSGYHDNDESKHFAPFWNIVENARLHIEVEVEGRSIRKCWWHQLGKEDFRFERLSRPSTSRT